MTWIFKAGRRRFQMLTFAVKVTFNRFPQAHQEHCVEKVRKIMGMERTDSSV